MRPLALAPALALAILMATPAPAQDAAGSGAIVFVRAATQDAGPATLQRLDLDTGEVRQIARWRMPITDVVADPDRDSVTFAVVRTDFDALRSASTAGGSSGQFYTLRPGRTFLGLSWLPSGRRLIYSAASANQEKSDLYSITPRGKDPDPITFDNRADLHPAVLPDGQRILFARQGPTGFDLYTVKVEGGGLRRLTFTNAQEYWPAVAPDGGRIAYSRDNGSRLQLVIADADGSEPMVVPDAPRNAIEPAWSPDGQQIVFSGQSRNGPPQLYAVAADGTGVRRLLTSRSVDSRPVYVP